MCGIAGYVRFDNKPADPVIIKKMTDAMAHRGPNADGFYIKNSVALGHRRLSIIDLSETANQPFVNVSGTLRLVFNGELYNFREVKASLKGQSFRTASDTEVLAEAYALQGIDCIKQFKGMFAFGIWDERKQELCVARDRMGVKPLYYYSGDDFFIFASEIRGILASGLIIPSLNKNALRDYFSYQSVSSPESIIEGIKQLEAGHYILIRNKNLEIKPYWDISAQRSGFDFSSREAVTKNIKQLLLQSVEGRMISDVSIGAFLSGGIDSSAVVGLMSSISTSSVNTFTVSFDEEGYDESPYAAIIAKKFNTNHQRIILQPTVMLEELQNALHAMDTPSGDGINTYVVSKAVKRAGLTVALSGIGGDELFAGYPFFKSFTKLSKFGPIWNHSVGLRKMIGKMIGWQANSSSAIKLTQLLNTKTAQIEDVYQVFRKIISDDQLKKITTFSNGSPTYFEKKFFSKASAIRQFPLLSQVSIAEFMGYTQQTLLKDTDQMSMAVSLEVREPFFDHELVEYVLNIPDHIKKPTYPKKLLVEALGDLLPAEIVHRKKQGFTFPWALWMKNELRAFCEENIYKISERDFIIGKELIKTWEAFLTGDPRIRWMEIWLFVILECWLEKNGIH